MAQAASSKSYTATSTVALAYSLGLTSGYCTKSVPFVILTKIC